MNREKKETEERSVHRVFLVLMESRELLVHLENLGILGLKVLKGKREKWDCLG